MRTSWKNCFRVGASAFCFYLLIHNWGTISAHLGLVLYVARPLGIGCCIAYVANILMSAFERHWKGGFRYKRQVCIALSLLTIAALMYIFVGLILPRFVSCVNTLIETLPGFLERAYQWLNETIHLDAFLKEHGLISTQGDPDWAVWAKQMDEWLINGWTGALSTVVNAATSVVSSVASISIGVVFAVYLLSGKERLAQQFERLIKRMIGSKRHDMLHHILSIINKSFRNYVIGQSTEALILGSLCTIGMLILRIPYALMVGPLVGLCALIPIVGAYISAISGAVMIFTVSTSKALIFIAFILLLQWTEANLIYPHVVGSRMGLPGIWIIAAVTIGGGCLGIRGMLIAVPLTTSVYCLLREYAAQTDRGSTLDRLLQ